MSEATDQVEELMQTLLDDYCTLRDDMRASKVETTERLQRIAHRLRKIKQTENSLRPLREAMRENRVELSSSLQQLSNETIEVIQDVIPMLNELETESQKAMKKLFPHVRTNVRGMLMREAYAVR
ncbi:MAG: hypothetical protein VXZ82_04555 [Planctomycetota bacterium]|nr:hypothetical protein [Planctomycetota bacterium]